MRLLLDTNVLLDLVLARHPWANDAAAIVDAVVRERAEGYVASHAITTVHYVVARAAGATTATAAVAALLGSLDVVALGRPDFQRALTIPLADYEDAVHVAAALRTGADFLVTRDVRDFRDAPIAVRTPGEILARL